jgi:hypothetical protein
MLLSSGRAHSQAGHPQQPWEQGVTAQQMEQAHLHFQLALALHKQLLLEEAAVEYEQALTHWKHPKIYFYLSRVWMKLGRPVAAYETLREALRWGQRGLLAHDYEMARRMQEELLATQIAEVEVICGEAGAEVTLDGRLLFVGPAQHRVIVPAGKHQIVAKKPGYLTETSSVAVFPGERKRIGIELRRVEEIASTTRRWESWKPWAVVGTGVTVVMIGALTHMAAASNFANYDREFAERCPSPSGCFDSDERNLSARLHRARIQQGVALSSYVVGGLASACGILFIYLNEPETLIMRTPNPGVPGVSLMPVLPLSPGLGVSAEIHF